MSKQVYLYNDRYFFWPKIKFLAKRLLGRTMRGPLAVEQSLLRGLGELGVEAVVNQKPPIGSTVGVLSGVKTLKKVLEWKQQGVVKKIIAGPNLVVTPDDDDKVIQHPDIDIILQPGEWSKDFYLSLAPALKDKIKIFASGVSVPRLGELNKINDFLIYNKTADKSLCPKIIEMLRQKGYSRKVLNYGDFGQKDYFKNLEESRYLIYLPDSESQGLALFEAWARNVPALVWERGFWRFGKYFWEGRTATNYVAPENGLIFRKPEELEQLLSTLESRIFAPREFVLKNFTDKITAEKYLALYFS